MFAVILSLYILAISCRSSNVFHIFNRLLFLAKAKFDGVLPLNLECDLIKPR